METIEASVLGTVFRNEENGYTVLSVRIGTSESTVVGTLPHLAPGEQAVFTGEWIKHTTYGQQFKCTGCTLQKPTTLLGIERYLGSGLIRGVGPSTARQIVEQFGEDTFDVLLYAPEKLQGIKGMGRKRWKQVAESFREQQAAREAMVFLQSYGIPANLSVKISKMYGERTAAVIRENPYRLCEDIDGIGFMTADRIGTALGISPESPNRIQAALKYQLQDASVTAGHVYLPEPELTARTAEALRLDEDMVICQLQQMVLHRELVLSGTDDCHRVYLPKFDHAEKEVAQRMCELMMSAAVLPKTDISSEIDMFEAKNHITFSDKQRDAIKKALTTGVMVITGGPGTGKTTIINCIIQLLQKNGTVLLCAPTGRAAKRMTEATGQESKTIHRLLEYSGEEGKFSRNADNTLEGDAVICDETSMVDLMLMRSLLRAIEPGTRFILVGDSDQLPSVGAGNVLGDILASGAVPSVRLTDIFRQAETSRIVVNAHRINHGEMPYLNEKGTDFFFERRAGFPDTAQTIMQLMTQRLPAFLHIPPEERSKMIQVLAPARKGECGVTNLNRVLQEALNPPHPGVPQKVFGDTVYREGDKVIQVHNDYQMPWRKFNGTEWETGEGIFNGDVGNIIEVDTEENTLTVHFEDDREVVYAHSDLENLELAYCLTVHKSQGSEFPVVVMPVAGGPAMLLTRNLFYTALTRAKKMVVLVGREEIIGQMVRNDYILKRYTTLTERLMALSELMHK